MQRIYMHKELKTSNIFPLHKPSHEYFCIITFPYQFKLLHSYIRIFYVANLYPSKKKYWEPIECILNIADAHHSSIREKIYKERKGCLLAKHVVSFYNHHYSVLQCIWILYKTFPFQSKDWTSPS